MTCRQCRRLLSPHLDNALAADEQSSVLAHLAQCSACAERLHQFESNRQLLRALPTAEVSKGMELLLQSRIHNLESKVQSSQSASPHPHLVARMGSDLRRYSGDGRSLCLLALLEYPSSPSGVR